MLTFRNSFPPAHSSGKFSFNGFLKASWHVHEEWHGANASQWVEAVMKMSEDKKLANRAPTKKPKPGLKGATPILMASRHRWSPSVAA